MPTGIKFIPSLLNGISSVGVGLSTIIGPTGPAGAFGGPQGLQGISGTNGVQGFQGIAGTIGIDGVQGLKGDTGEGFKVFATSYSYTGLNSIIATGGNVGEFVLITGGDLFVYSGTGAGTTGPNISYSYAGDITDESKLIGVQGFQGLAGTTGTNGVQGVQGLAGSTGPSNPGVQGFQGFSSTGTQGLQGLVGFQGIAGAAVGSLANVKMSFTRTVDSPGVSNTGNRLYAFSGATGVFNTPSSNITFTPSNGRFTVSEQGDYYFDTRLIVQSTQSPDQVMFDVHLNTGTVYSYRHTVYGIVSPAPMPIGLYLPMNAGDYVHLSCYSTGTAGPITVKAGSTMNLYRMTNGPTGAQGSIGFQGLQGLQGNQGVQGLQGIQGNIGIQGTPGPTGTLSGTVTFTQGSSIPVNADVNNYSISDGTIFSMTGSGGFSFNGIANGLIGRFIVLINNSAGNITFKQENAGSTASNRFSLSTSQITVGIDSTITFIYGSTSIGNRWLCIAKQ